MHISLIWLSIFLSFSFSTSLQSTPFLIVPSYSLAIYILRVFAIKRSGCCPDLHVWDRARYSTFLFFRKPGIPSPSPPSLLLGILCLLYHIIRVVILSVLGVEFDYPILCFDSSLSLSLRFFSPLPLIPFPMHSHVPVK